MLCRKNKAWGGQFQIDVDIYTDFSQAAQHDSLHETINYLKVYNFISSLVVGKKYYLIETLASKIADGLLENFNNINKIAVRVRKNNVPLGGVVDCVEAEVIKENDR
ncbi:MAG TPA: dihydroneopterin aldolase [Ignavibacteriales bacterium]|nr:dihydroneopterin aldolase [Ignavibacteriales bacterium]